MRRSIIKLEGMDSDLAIPDESAGGGELLETTLFVVCINSSCLDGIIEPGHTRLEFSRCDYLASHQCLAHSPRPPLGF